MKLYFFLGGLALGLFVHKTWFAQRFSGEDLEELGRAISTLFQLYAEVRMIKANLDTLATVSDNTARFEAVRQYALRKFVRKDEFFRQEIHLARIAVAKHVPLALYQLEKVLKLYEYFQNAKFEEYTQDRGTYILRLTGFGKSFHKNQLLVAYIIRDLAKSILSKPGYKLTMNSSSYLVAQASARFASQSPIDICKRSISPSFPKKKITRILPT